MKNLDLNIYAIFLDQWELALLLVTWAIIGIIAIRRRIDWRQRRFTQQVNFSLNILKNRDKTPVLQLRTLLEDSAINVWLNEFGVSLVLKAARLTTPQKPFLRIEQQRDRDLVMIAVLNVLSERFSEVFVARALGMPVTSDMFLYGLTWERYGKMKTQKLRVLVIRESELEHLFKMNAEKNKIDTIEESHSDRLETLRIMYELRTSDNPAERDMIRRVELGLPL